MNDSDRLVRFEVESPAPIGTPVLTPELSVPQFESIAEPRWNSTLGLNEIIHENSRRWEAQLSVRQPVILFGYPTNGYLSLNNTMYRYAQLNEGLDVKYYNRYFIAYEQPFFQPNVMRNNLEKARLDLESAELDYLDDVVRVIDLKTQHIGPEELLASIPFGPSERIAIGNDLDNLAAIVGDWAPWDDAYHYALGTNPAFTRSNLDRPTLENLDLDAMLVYDREGRLLVGNRPRFSAVLYLDELRTEIYHEFLTIGNAYREERGADDAWLQAWAVVDNTSAADWRERKPSPGGRLSFDRDLAVGNDGAVATSG